jgi:catechol 2,3-dioxygenase
MKMRAGINELFGHADAPQPAYADSYGIRPPAYRLPDATRIRNVTLQVSDLERSREFYENTLGFRPLQITAHEVSLGAADSNTPLVTLIEQRAGQRRSPRKSLGLYHVAILLPSRGDLGRFLRHLEHSGVRAGAGDHVVSEALYLQDPDNLGIEVYADRPRDTWRRSNNELVMATDPVDVRALLDAGGTEAWTGMPAGTTIGHVHLHVGDIETAARFYSDAVGLDRVVWSYPGALFLSAGGYHHHLGTNVWAGAGATSPSPDDPRLLEWVLEVPSLADVTQVAESLGTLGYATARAAEGAGIVARDPWGTALRIDAARA